MRKHGELYDIIYRYGDRHNLMFEEVVSILLEVCDEEHLMRAVGVSKKKPAGGKPIKDATTGKWVIPTPLDELGIKLN